MTRLAHLTDLHLSPLRPERSERFTAIVNRLGAVGATHLCITGDLTAAAREEEWAELSRVLAPLAPHAVTIVPGNHDFAQGEPWLDVMRRLPGIGRFAWTSVPGTPVDLGDCVLLPVSTQYPRRALGFRALGRAGPEAIASMRGLAALERRRPVVVLMHHGPNKRGLLSDLVEGLTDQRAVLAALHDYPNLHVLSGHDHEIVDHGRVHVAADLADHHDPLRLYDVAPSDQGPTLAPAYQATASAGSWW